MPRYSSKEILREKLKSAIHFCKSIDTDEYARIALTTDAHEDASSDGHFSESSDITTDSDGVILSSEGWLTLSLLSSVLRYALFWFQSVKYMLIVM